MMTPGPLKSTYTPEEQIGQTDLFPHHFALVCFSTFFSMLPRPPLTQCLHLPPNTLPNQYPMLPFFPNIHTLIFLLSTFSMPGSMLGNLHMVCNLVSKFHLGLLLSLSASRQNFPIPCPMLVGPCLN